MPSPQLLVGRRSVIGNVYAITMICKDRCRVFDDPSNAQIAMQVLEALDHDGLVASFAWVVMPDHLHWLVQLREKSLGYCVQRFKSRSGLRINQHRGHTGAVWQAGYYDHAIRSEESLRKHGRYILGNPVRAGLATTLGEYPHGWCRWPLDDTGAG
ncbi:REP-associated tyrosine transposase [Stenotrophomonas sp. NPDC077659]|uniref:REP-associated tyrosine transposase n=1 Tax=Stenotrophomonas sp. NPDC077659 TaxID=3390694 RepID=UPI003CFC7B1F